MGRREARVERRSPPHALDRRRELAFALGGLAEIVPRMGIVRRERDAAATQRFGRVRVRHEPQGGE